MASLFNKIKKKVTNFTKWVKGNWKKVGAVVATSIVVASGFVLQPLGDEPLLADWEDGDAFHHWYAPPDSFGISYMKNLNISYFEKWCDKYFDVFLNASPNNITWYDASDALTEIWNWSHENGSNAKISWIINTTSAPTDLFYRLTIAIDARAKKYINSTGNHSVSFSFNVSNNETYDLYFNWSDIIPLIQSDKVFVKRGIKKVGNDSYFWARIQSKNKIPVDTVFVIDPWFGNQTAGSLNRDIEQNIRGSVDAPASSGTADAVCARIFIGNNPHGNSIKCALYLNSTKALVTNGVTEERNIGYSGFTKWHTFNFTTPPTISSGTDYLIVTWANATATQCNLKSSSGGWEWRDTNAYNGFPNPTVETNTYTYTSSIYCNYTVSAADKNMSTTIRNDGIDYFTWLGKNTTAYTVHKNITGFDEATEYVAILNASGDWYEHYQSAGDGNNWSINTFDVVKVYLTDGANTNQTFNMTLNSGIDYHNITRKINLVNVGNGYNYSGWTNRSVANTSLYAEATNLSLATGYMIALWNETNFVFDPWIMDFGFTDKHIHLYDVMMTKIGSNKNNWWI